MKQHKLTQEKADEIRQLYTTTNLSQAEIAKRSGVQPTTVSKIMRGKIWKKRS